MFYSTQVLARKGPLGVIWLAAHMDNKLKKNNVFEANLVGSIESILNPEVPLALRLSGQLLLGVVNIYKKKVLYLFEDCNDAISKMQQAFKSGAPVLQNGGKAAPMQVTIMDDFLLGSMDQFNDNDFNYTSFDLSQPLDLGIGSKGSLMLADDGAVFTTPISYHDEQFEVDDDELERTLSLGSAERLRDAAVPAMQSISGGPAYPSPGKVDEMLPDIPADDMLYVGTNHRGPLSSPAASERMESGLGDIEIDDLDTLMGTSDLGRPQLELADDPGEAMDSQAVARPAKLQAGEKRKRAVRDIDGAGQPVTVIPTAQIRSLMADRAPLLKAQKRLTKASVRGMVYATPKAALGEASWLLQPAVPARLAPALQGLYERCIKGPCTNSETRQPEGAAHDQTREEAAEAAPDAYAGGTATESGMLQLAASAPESREVAGVEIADYEAGEPGFEAEYNMDSSTPHELDVPVATPSSHRKQASQRRGSIGISPRSPSGGVLAQEEFSSKTEALLHEVKAKLRLSARSKQRGGSRKAVSFAELQSSSSRSEAALLFFELLVLQSRQQVALCQDEPFAEIRVALHNT